MNHFRIYSFLLLLSVSGFKLLLGESITPIALNVSVNEDLNHKASMTLARTLAAGDGKFTATRTLKVNALPAVIFLGTSVGVTGLNFSTSVAGAGTHPIKYSYPISNGYSNTSANTLEINALPTVVITKPEVGCSHGTVDITLAAITTGSTAGLTFTYWTDAAATIPYATPTAATAGTYYIKGTTPEGYFNIQPVMVTDNENPVVPLTTYFKTTSEDGSGKCTVDLAISDAKVRACSIAKLTWAMTGATVDNSPSTGINQVGTHTFNIGLTTITYTVTDGAGRTATGIKYVTVADNENPVITCIPSTSKNADASQSYYTVIGNEFNATATDGCGIASMTYTLIGATTGSGTTLAGVHLNVGINTVVWTAIDIHGNTSYRTTTITVQTSTTTATYKGDVTPSYSGEFYLKVYPNPFTDHINFDLQLMTNSKVWLEIYDINGSKITTLFGIVVAYNPHTFEYVPKNLPTGTLIYRLLVDGQLLFIGKLIHF